MEAYFFQPGFDKAAIFGTWILNCHFSNWWCNESMERFDLGALRILNAYMVFGSVNLMKGNITMQLRTWNAESSRLS